MEMEVIGMRRNEEGERERNWGGLILCITCYVLVGHICLLVGIYSSRYIVRIDVLCLYLWLYSFPFSYTKQG